MKQNWIKFRPLMFNWWRLGQRFSRLIIKRRIKFIDDYFKKRSLKNFGEGNSFSICYAESLRDFYDPYAPFYDGPIEEKEILKNQIKHLDGILEVLQEVKKRGLSLKEVQRERGWLKDQLKQSEK